MSKKLSLIGMLIIIYLFPLSNNYGEVNAGGNVQVKNLEKGYEKVKCIVIKRDDVKHISFYITDSKGNSIETTGSISNNNFTMRVIEDVIYPNQEYFLYIYPESECGVDTSGPTIVFTSPSREKIIPIKLKGEDLIMKYVEVAAMKKNEEGKNYPVYFL